MKTALVHDDLLQAGGAERVFAEFHRMWPQAPLYTSLYDPKTTFSAFQGADVRTSFLQRWPIAGRKLHKLALPFFPAAFEEMDLSGYDLVLSSSSRFAKGVITSPETCHICYCHSPARFLWRQNDYLARSRVTRLIGPLLWPMLARLRAWDLECASRVDYFIANSHNVAGRIRKFYRRDAAVIHPPVETAQYHPVPASEVGEFFLVVSRLVGYKRVDLAVEACSRLGLPLKVVGGGPDLAALKRKAGPTVQFLGRLSDPEVAALYARCKAFIFAGEEDFGITPLEAMASGRPVVAYGVGGALESVVEGKTGLFFSEQTPDSLAQALRALDGMTFVPEELRAHAERFDSRLFQAQIRQFIEIALPEHQRLFTDGRVSKPPLPYDRADLLAPLSRRFYK